MARLELAYFIPTVPFTMLFSPPHSYKLVLGTLEDTQVVLFLLQDGVRGAVRQLPKRWYVPPSEAHNVWLCLFVILLSVNTHVYIWQFTGGCRMFILHFHHCVFIFSYNNFIKEKHPLIYCLVTQY